MNGLISLSIKSAQIYNFIVEDSPISNLEGEFLTELDKKIIASFK